MTVADWMYAGLRLAVFAVMCISSIYGMYGVYYAYFKTKDERQKLIVLRSTAAAFAVLLVYFLLESVLQFFQLRWLLGVWNWLHFGIEATVAFGMLSVLGVCLFIAKRRAGGD